MKYFIHPNISNLQNNAKIAPSSSTVRHNAAIDSVMTIDTQKNEMFFDLRLLEEMDDNEYTSDILTVFLGNTPKEMNELKNACIANKYDLVHKIAHKIKGSAGMLQANYFLNVLVEIEESAKAEKTDELVNLALRAIEEYKKLELPLKKHLLLINKELRKR
jgi:HPt (histidine-containing phosphotransfer) domain-containing protein